MKMGMEMNSNTKNNIKWTTKGRRVNNRGITNIHMVRSGQLVHHLNIIARIHSIKFREVEERNILKFKRDNRKR